MFPFALTITLSAFLLFQVQPLIGKYILPWFGGGPAVWTTCLLFFQVVLLAGYTWSHLVTGRFSARAQAWLQVGLLLGAACFLPIGPSPETWKPAAFDAPAGRILLLLLATVGLPAFALPTTAPLIQRWFTRAFQGRSPYRLYALSNAGSLLALLSYPVIVEPLLPLERQTRIWSLLFVAFALATLWCALRARLGAAGPAAPQTGESPALSVREAIDALADADGGSNVPRRLAGVFTVTLWILLAAAGSAMLLATTNQLCQEVAAAPFLWILPLSIYLITFIICFDKERWFSRWWSAPLLLAAVPFVCAVFKQGVDVPLVEQIAAYSAVLFACCFNCHGELVRAKPHPRQLTLFYLCIAFGGALGGAFTAIAAPYFFVGFWEFHIALVACCLLTALCWLRDRPWERVLKGALGLGATFAIALALGAGITFLGGFLQTMAAETDENAIRRVRNFYGILKVTEKEDLVGLKRTLTNGQICHGFQYMDEDKRRWTTSYYGPQSGFGLAMTHHPRRGSPEPLPRDLRLGVVGLGTGSTAAYGREGDYIRFYDINADVKMLAENYFSYLLDCPAPVDVILGDARISLESELARGEAQEFDVLAIDAFTSDSIPIHLLTRECAEIYWRHLKPDGLLLLHISNRFLDLEPVALGLKESLGCQAVLVSSSDDDEFGIYSASWVILTNNDEFLAIPEVVDRISEWPEIRGKPCEPLQWTDSFASLWQVVDFGWKWPPSWLPDFLRGKESR